MSSEYGDFSGVDVKTEGSVQLEPSQPVYFHIDNVDRDLLPVKSAIERDANIYICGPEDRSTEIQRKAQDFRDDFIFATGLIVND